MEKYTHSVTLEKDKCKGCTNCIKRCPTEAIRVRNGKASIINERCIDCGECIRVCPYHAKVAITDPLSKIQDYKYRIALPAPALYGQFEEVTNPNEILNGLKQIGFNAVYEVARGADYVSQLVKETIEKDKSKRPYISSACPAVVRLMQIRFPELLKNITPIEAPIEISAQLARNEFCEKHQVEPSEVGVFFISPCAAKMTAVKQPLGSEKSYIDGVISIMEVYGGLAAQLPPKGEIEELQRASYFGIGWANSGGETKAVNAINSLSVDGIHNVIKALEAIENGKLNDLDFFEGLACTGGCVGGALTFENGFVASNRVRQMAKQAMAEMPSEESFQKVKESTTWYLGKPIKAKHVMTLDDDFRVAIKKMTQLEEIYERLPMLDCGSCGCPTCRSLAEDIVRGEASEMDCIILLKEKIQKLAGEMAGLSDIKPQQEGDKK